VPVRGYEFQHAWQITPHTQFPGELLSAIRLHIAAGAGKVKLQDRSWIMEPLRLDHLHQSPLHFAALHGRTAIVKILL